MPEPLQFGQVEKPIPLSFVWYNYYSTLKIICLNFVFIFVSICDIIEQRKAVVLVNFKVITSEKYLQYFLSDNEHRMSDTTMMEFLNDMIVVSESMDTVVPPTETIKEIMGKCGLDGSLYDCITQIVNSNLLDALTAFETFTLLWFVSCKNLFTYQDGIYLRYANNGVIGKLLKKLA
jgi:hypothetical protein